MRILKSYFLLLFFLSNLMIFGQEISFQLQFHNQRVYYPNDSIWIRASIRNNSGEDFVFSLADQSERNVELSVRTLTNQALPVSENYMLRTASNEAVYYRLIKLLPGEEHSFLININDFVELKEPGNFIVQARFSPNVQSNQSPLIESNALRLSLRPSSPSSQFINNIDQQTGEILHREALAPDEVITFALSGRQLSQWNRVFLYFNLEALYKQNSDRRIHFLNSSESRRQELLSTFQEEIKSGQLESGVATAPDEFEILQVSYTPSNATVLTRQVYYRAQFNEVKQFIWHLERNQGIWLITGFAVQNLGGQ